MAQVLIDALLKGMTGGVAALLALILLLAGPRERATRYLGVFLLFIAGNQAAETVASFAHGAGLDTLAWWRVATAFAALDPLLLYLFAAHFPERNALHRPWRVAALAAGSLALLVASLGVDPSFTHPGPARPSEVWGHQHPLAMDLFSGALSAFTALVYTLALVHAARQLRRAPDPGPWRLLHAALLLAALTPWRSALDYVRAVVAFLMEQAGWVLTYFGGLTAALLSTALAALLGVALALRAQRATPAADVSPRRSLWWGTGIACAHLAIFSTEPAWNFVDMLPDGEGDVPFPVSGLPPGVAAMRWMLFGAFVSIVLLRRASGLPALRRIVAARVLAGMALLVPSFLLLSIVQRSLGEKVLTLRAIDWVYLGGLVALSQGFRSLVDRVAGAVYGAVPGPPAAPPAPEGPLLAGALVAGRYEVRAFLGRGGSGRAFLATDRTLLRDVVLKEVPEEDAEASPGLREARIAGSLHHPNVLAVHDVLQRPGAALLVYEYASGGSLADRIAAGGPLPHEEGVRLLEGVLDGLAAAHARGIIHRDLTPSNVLLDARGAPRLADFGLAARAATVHLHGAPRPGEGTPGFMAPEQRDGGPVTPATDVYAAGLLFQRCVQPGAPSETVRVFERALHPDPAQRWADAAQMREALRRARAAPPQAQ